MAATRKIRLGALLHTGGQHVAAWRHPQGVADAGVSLEAYRRLAGIAEDARFDFIFVADQLGFRDWPVEVVAQCSQLSLLLEPMTLMSALAPLTRNIGFVVTASTSYSFPYQVARQFASLDLLSGGRAAWNVVTSVLKSEAANFGLDRPEEHGLRYRRAAEFVAVVQGLWRSVGQDAMLLDTGTGRMFDAAQVAALHHDGEFFRVDGILNVPPSPQGRPVIAQAGASEAGRSLAAAVAEIVFVTAPNVAVARETYADIKRRMVAFGRDPAECLVMPGIVPMIGADRADAYRRLRELDALLPADVAVTVLSDILPGLAAYDIDGPFPRLDVKSGPSHTMVRVMTEIAESEGLSIRQTSARYSSAMSHMTVFGTPEEIADTMEAWFVGGACDGFLVSPFLAPLHLQEFCELVLPELRRRGLFRDDYESDTLRGNLGLVRPGQ